MRIGKGTVVAGRYRVNSKLGDGETSTVYRVSDASTGGEFVLKVLRSSHADAETLARFVHEARTLAKFDHENVIKLKDEGHDRAHDLHFIVLEYVEGAYTLDDWLARGAPRLKTAMSLSLQLADAVQHAHQKQIIHRDLKPRNILVAGLRSEPVVKVIDWGAALDPSQTRITGVGELLGSIAYLDPRLLLGLETAVTTYSDAYALGAIVYELLCGQPPVPLLDDVDGFLAALETLPVTPPQERSKRIDQGLSDAVMRLIDWREGRASLLELRSQLRRLLE